VRIKVLVFLIIATITFSCNDSTKKGIKADAETEELNETPQSLEENADFELGSLSKRYDADIISKLYEEAIEKDTQLKRLNSDINKMSVFKSDSLAEYLKFSQSNRHYWLRANSYVDQLQDTILKESTRELFQALELKYQTKMSAYEESLSLISEKTIVMKDQLIVLKLLITAPMMNNYQINEKPNIKTLENIIDQYDKLIKETQGYTKKS